MESLLQIPVCVGDKSLHLRMAYDKIKVNVQRLEALGVRAEEYGNFLIPITMARLRLQIVRVTNKDVWEVAELQVIKAEVKAPETSDTIKIREGQLSELLYRNGRPTASTLLIESTILEESVVWI